MTLWVLFEPPQRALHCMFGSSGKQHHQPDKFGASLTQAFPRKAYVAHPRLTHPIPFLATKKKKMKDEERKKKERIGRFGAARSQPY